MFSRRKRKSAPKKVGRGVDFIPPKINISDDDFFVKPHEGTSLRATEHQRKTGPMKSQVHQQQPSVQRLNLSENFINRDAYPSPSYLTRNACLNSSLPNPVGTSCLAKMQKSERRTRFNMEMICEKYTRIDSEMTEDDHDIINLDTMQIEKFGSEKYSVFSESYVPRGFGEFVPLDCPYEDPDEVKELRKARRNNANNSKKSFMDLSTMLDDMKSEYNEHRELKSKFLEEEATDLNESMTSNVTSHSTCCGKDVPFDECVRKSLMELGQVTETPETGFLRYDGARSTADGTRGYERRLNEDFSDLDSISVYSRLASKPKTRDDALLKSRLNDECDTNSLVSGFGQMFNAPLHKRKAEEDIFFAGPSFKRPKIPNERKTQNCFNSGQQSKERSGCGSGHFNKATMETVVRRSPQMMAKLGNSSLSLAKQNQPQRSLTAQQMCHVGNQMAEIKAVSMRNKEMATGADHSSLSLVVPSGIMIKREAYRLIMERSWKEMSIDNLIMELIRIQKRTARTFGTHTQTIERRRYFLRSGPEPEEEDNVSITSGPMHSRGLTHVTQTVENQLRTFGDLTAEDALSLRSGMGRLNAGMEFNGDERQWAVGINAQNLQRAATSSRSGRKNLMAIENEPVGWNDGVIDEELRSGDGRLEENSFECSQGVLDGSGLNDSAPLNSRENSFAICKEARMSSWVHQAMELTVTGNFDEAADVRQGERLDRQLVANAKQRNKKIKLGFIA